MKKRFLSITVVVAVVLALTPCVFAANISTSGATVKGGDTITADGTYQVAANATGTITIAAGKTVTLTGNGTGEGASANEELSIQCGAGVILTVKDLWIRNEQCNDNLINFTGTGNILKTEGTSLLESTAYKNPALIHVGPGTDLSFQDGGGTLYIYKYTAGSGIGSDAEEANGTITFDGGRYFIKGSKTGAVIGNDTCGDAAKEAQIGPVNIRGGELYIEANAQGAAIGGSRMSVGGDVSLSGGTVGIWMDFSASAIGSGAVAKSEGRSNGTLTVTGGSLKVYVNKNAVYDWDVVEAQVCDNPITVKKVNGSGQDVVRYLLDVSGYTANSSGPAYSVKVDGKEYYNGPLHQYTYSANTGSTIANWVAGNDQNLYLYLTEGSHQISVNGSAPQAVTVTAPVYENGKITVPAESWADHTDINWYNGSSAQYTIRTNQQLAGLASIVSAGTDSFEGKTITLGEDLSLQAYAWEPIGTADHPFKGTFDGGNHTVSWILIDQTSKHELGLFGAVQDGTVQDLTVSNGSVSGFYNVGAVAGYAVDAEFANCTSNVTLFAQYTGNTGGGQCGDYVGGIVGLGRRCTVTNCENQGFVSGNRRVGGIAGGFTGTMSQCINNGNCLTRNENCAGIIGEGCVKQFYVNDVYDVINNSLNCEPLTLNGCVNNAEIGGLTASGIVSHIEEGETLIQSCKNNGDVDCGRKGGGIIGNGLSTKFWNKTVTGCINNGTVKSTQGDGQGVGGIAGDFSGSILSCRNTGSVIGGANCMTDSYGGIAGYMAISDCMEDCYNSGTVSSSKSTDYVGALIGRIGTLEKDVAEADFVSTLEASMTGYRNNLYASGTAAGALGGVARRTSSNVEYFALNRDIAGKLEVDPETVVVKRGDVNGDGNVSLKDVNYLARYLAKQTGYTLSETSRLAADVNKDGNVSLKDVNYLARYLAKQPGYTLN